MSATFSWSVATPEGTVASGECEFLVVPTSGGELGVLADHTALVARVVPGDLRVTTGGIESAGYVGEVRTVSVGAGVVDVRDNQVRLLVTRAAVSGTASG
ncbi:MAG: FoF1 ATP synthase subunit delta/epsilon [Spirochaetia bacterium]